MTVEIRPCLAFTLLDSLDRKNVAGSNTRPWEAARRDLLAEKGPAEVGKPQGGPKMRSQA